MAQLAMGITLHGLHQLRDVVSRFFYSKGMFGKILGEIWEESNLVAQALKEWRKNYEPGKPAHPDSDMSWQMRPMSSTLLSSSMQEDATMSPPSQPRHEVLTAWHS